MEVQNKPSIDLTKLPTLLPNPSPAFRIWMTGVREDQFEIAIASLIQSGKAKNPEEALLLLNELVKSVPLEESSYLTSFDLWEPNKQKDYFQKAKRLLNGTHESTTRNPPWRLHGIIGHALIPEILAGNLPKKIVTRPKKANPAQPSFFFDTAINGQLTLLDKENQEWILSSSAPEIQRNKEALSRIIKKSWGRIASHIEEAKDPKTVLISCRDEIKRFWQTMEWLFGSYVYKLQKDDRAEDNYLILLTLMSWTTALMQPQRNRILFKEIPVMEKRPKKERRYGLSGGRIDALEVRLINGKTPDATQRKHLEAMTRIKFPSVGNLLLSLQQHFGEITTVILDWKFAVGDAVVENNKTEQQTSPIINPSDINDGPLGMHVWQMSRYLTMASLSYHLLCKERGIENHWPENNQFGQGEITYFMPTILPVTHKVSITPTEQDLFFTDEVATQWTPAQVRAVVRHCNQQIAVYIDGLLNGEQKNHNGSPQPQAKTSQTNFWTEEKQETPESHSAKYMIDKRRKFVDEHQIIEVVGRRTTINGQRVTKPKHTLHLDRLLEALKERKVAAGYFSLPHGGFVRCIAPDHKNEKTPSLHISIDQGVFKCFGAGCGIGGPIVPTSIPADLNVPIRSTQWVRRTFGNTINAPVPDEEHLKIMSSAQDILHNSFKGSTGEFYITQERKLNSDVAFQHGVGFGTDTLIEVLLDSGFTLEQLVFYGFVGISENYQNRESIVELLRRRNIAQGRVRLEIPNRGSNLKEVVEGFPYSALKGRVTFPLTLKGQINNFYGRTVCGHPVKHWKLTKTFTGVPHGAFNTDVLYGQASEVIPVEAAIDTLTLIEMGHPTTLAMIGTDNTIIIEEIVLSGKKVAIGLDYDEGGRKKTCGYKNTKEEWVPGLLEIFQKKGKKPEDIRDFTADFAQSHPDMKGGMDWNDWWKNTKIN